MSSNRPVSTPSDAAAAAFGRPASLHPRGRPRGAQTRLLNTGSGPVGRHHFAFLRALLDGIELEQAWRTYLSFSGGSSDRRQVVGHLRQLVQALARAGGQHGCAPAVAVALPALQSLPDLARRRGLQGAGEPGHLAAAATAFPPPTLDDWRARQCGSAGIDEDFYTEAEWLALYADAFGLEAPARAPRAGNAGQLATRPAPALAATIHAAWAEATPAPGTSRLAPSQRRAVLDALSALEQALAREAQLGDATGFWLAGRLPRQLARAGVRTLGDLVSLINLQGFRWHRRVPGLGVVRAQRVLAWLVPVAQAGGQPVLETSRRPETDLVLARRRQQLAPPTGPAAPAGSVVSADAAAVSRWLDGQTDSTRRAYARVTERFLRWARELRQRPLADLTPDDLQAYLDFVRAPPADWVQTRRVRRENPAWRPFQGPLGPASQRHELAVLASLLGDLHAAGHLPRNPAARFLRRLDLPSPTVDVGRSLSPAQWAFAQQVLHEKPDTPARRRLQLLLALAGTAGLQLAELATTRVHALRRSTVDGLPVWLLDVAGRGGKIRTVPLPDHVRSLLVQHHRDMEAAGLGFDAGVARVQAPCPARPRVTGCAHRQTTADLSAPDDPAAWRPLLGILRRPPPRRSLDALGLPVVERAASSQADRYGALERSAIDKLLRRFFHGVAREAAARSGAPSADAFLAASSHWLRHTFAHQAAQQLPPPLLQQVLGHANARVTARYLATDTAALVRRMRALQPLDDQPDGA